MREPTNTERLIAALAAAKAHGTPTLMFMVGKNTGNGPSVVSALRRRGFTVDRIPGPTSTSYILRGNPKSTP